MQFTTVFYNCILLLITNCNLLLACSLNEKNLEAKPWLEPKKNIFSVELRYARILAFLLAASSLATIFNQSDCFNSSLRRKYFYRTRSMIQTGIFAAADIWKTKDETLNKEQMHDEDMIKEVKRSEVEEELRRQVDYLMREELDILKIVSRSTSA